MFSFFNKTSPPIFEGLCDIHNHLLPGIDDGCKEVQDSHRMLEAYKELGFVQVIPTPHVYSELYPNTPQSVKSSFDVLQDSMGSENIQVKRYAAEYMVDEQFMADFEQRSPELLLPNNICLVEIHFFGNTQILEQAGFQLLQQGIKPLLAHPERYHGINDLKKFSELKGRGFKLQLNALSLLGHYGDDVKQKAFKIMDLGLYDYLGTDAHRPGHLHLLKEIRLNKKQLLSWEEIRERQIADFR
ncbi:tyrosine-protein phosphatase [Aureitalea marina]|uniref:protein-tyrosine-phosphatase n=1 Tax=Aureitalea marina TaxID=930804 RepID=A0A2S7KNT7_9FLAO|nr:CpsB/CapC family capsule biosynthesis tyrosine phosphatase [Aureitalea marina]PQB04248.1 hypothetical protein BST85_04515 [Aureitalea marina]